MLNKSSWKQFGDLANIVLRETERKQKAQEAFARETFAQECAPLSEVAKDFLVFAADGLPAEVKRPIHATH